MDISSLRYRDDERLRSITDCSGCRCLRAKSATCVAFAFFASFGLDPLKVGTHSLRRTKATLIYRRTDNLRGGPTLIGPPKIESTVRYLGVELNDAIEIAEKIEV